MLVEQISRRNVMKHQGNHSRKSFEEIIWKNHEDFETLKCQVRIVAVSLMEKHQGRSIWYQILQVMLYGYNLAFNIYKYLNVTVKCKRFVC
jgi:hypothetical protein